MVEAREGAWDAYWGEERLAACLRDPQGNYGGCIAQEWDLFFTDVPQGGNVLDIAAGNGAVALLGLATSDRLGLELNVEACDAARIDPASALEYLQDSLARISFRGEIRAEELPYDNSGFDVIASQYGIEYSDWTKALPEASRVLKPGGCLMFICHSTRSTVYATTVEQIRLISELQKFDLPGSVRQLLESESGGGSLHQENLHRFRRDAAQVMQRLDQSDQADRVFISQFLQRLGQAYQGRGQLGQKATLDGLKVLEHDLANHVSRLEALCDAALSEAEMGHFASLLESLSMHDVKSGSLTDSSDGSILGWKILARKNRSNG